MAKQTTLQEVQERIKSMTEQKAAELETIRQKQDEARTQLETAQQDMRAATEVMDVDAYTHAQTAAYKAQTALDMYSGRYRQIAQQEYVSEDESDKVIARLLQYEEQLETDFKAAIAEPLKALDKLQQDYIAEVRATENTILKWTSEIHANYKSEGTVFSDTGTNRSPRPIPVRRTPYTGCGESKELGEYLKKARPLMGA